MDIRIFRPRDISVILALLDHLKDIISIIDLNTGRFRYVNRATCEATGYSVSELRRMRVADIDPTIAGDWDREREIERRAVPPIYYREGRIRRRDGMIFPVEISSALFSLDGKEYMVASARDITGRVRAEKELRRAHDGLVGKVRSRTSELARARARLQQQAAKLETAEGILHVAHRRLREEKKALADKNAALREVLGYIESEKKKIRDDVLANVELLLPLLEKARLAGASGRYVDLLERGLSELTSSYGRRITDSRFSLTPRELEVCTMIKEGLTNKEIARLMGLSLQTIQSHRYRIRKKLGLLRKGVNLASFLNLSYSSTPLPFIPAEAGIQR